MRDPESEPKIFLRISNTAHQSRNPDQDQEQSKNEGFLPLRWHTAAVMQSNASFLNIYFSIKPNVTVADPNPNFSIPDPGSKRHRIPDPDTQLIFSSLTPEFSKKLL
jgi:hypothetical protein